MKHNITAFLSACAALALAQNVLAQETTSSAKHPGRHKHSLVERFKILDADGNGTLSKEEFLAPASKAANPEKARKHLEKRFNKLDKNKDGVISLDEFLAGAKHHHHHHHRQSQDGGTPAAG